MMFKIILHCFCFIIAGLISSLSYATPPVEDFVQLTTVRDAALSPDGKFLATISERNGRYVVATFQISPQGLTKPNAYDAGENARYNWVKWANNDTLLINFTLSEDVKRDVVESRWLYVADTTLNEVGPLLETNTLGGAVFLDYGHVVSFLPDEPDHILMLISDNQYESQDVHKINVRTADGRRVKRGSKKLHDWMTDRQGRLRLGVGSSSKGSDLDKIKRYIELQNLETGKWEDVSDHPKLGGNKHILGFDHDPNILYVVQYADKDTLGLYTYNIETKTISDPVHHNEDHDIGGLSISPDGKRVVGYYYSDEKTRVQIFDANQTVRQHQLNKAFPGFDVWAYDETPDGKWAVLNVSAGDYLPELILYNYDTNKASKLTSLYPKLTHMDVGPVKFAKYSARDGIKIPAYVTLPPEFFEGAELKDLPFVIVPHGGPESRVYGGFNYQAQLLANQGYGVLEMNFRGSSGYGKSFTDTGRENWQAMQDDIEDGTRWLIEKGYADPDKICVIGGSFGGYSAFMQVINNPELYACAASFGGIMDLPRLINDELRFRYGRQRVNYSIRAGFRDRKEMKQQSPARRVADIKVPILLAHGERDLVVDYKHQYKFMKSKLSGTYTDVTYVPLEDGDHFLSRSENRLKYHKALVSFLKEHLE